MRNCYPYCNLILVKRSVKTVGSQQTWLERCRCGKVVFVEMNWRMGTGLMPTVKKTWYSSDGKYEKVTGSENTTANTNAIANANEIANANVNETKTGS